MSSFSSANTIRSTSLNGWWDFCPAAAEDSMLLIPVDGWEEDVFQVPSSWTGTGSEAFAYPPAWSRTRQGWLRRFVRLVRHGSRRVVLQFDAAGPRATVFLNGAAVGESLDAFTPFEVDLTEIANPGVNELVVRILDTPRDEQGRARHPAGCGRFTGIWQDVRLVERAEVFVTHAAIRTFVREGRIAAEIELANASRRPRSVTVHHDVVRWKKTLRIATAPAELPLETRTLELPPRETVRYTIEAPWKPPLLWSPATPHLHAFRFRMEENGHALLVQEQRFGVREIVAEGPNLFLNGRPLRIFSDHGPAPALHFGVEGWVRRWFELLRSTGLNHARLPCACATRRARELADEEGMLLTLETALNGEADRLASDAPEFWVHAADHVRRLVLQNRNHPSVILWSIGHRVLDDLTTPSPAFRELPRLRRLVRELDPTRLAYFDGDSMHWSPDDQDLMDGPPGRFESIYDAPERPRLATAYAPLANAALYIQLARANGAAGIAVQSPVPALPRLPPRDIPLSHPDLEAPGLKLPRIPAGSAGLEFWTDVRKPNVPRCAALRAYAEAFQPLAVIDTTPATAGFPGQPALRRVVLCNDGETDLEGTLKAVFRLREAVFATQTLPVAAAQGGRHRLDFRFDVPADTAPGSGRIDYLWTDARGRTLARRRVPFRISAPAERPKRLARKTVAVLGPDELADWLETAGLAVARLKSLHDEALRKAHLLVLGPHRAEPGSEQLPVLRMFVHKGGGLVVLDQEHSPFPGILRQPRTAWLATLRRPGHDAFASLKPADLICWNNRSVAASGYVVSPATAPAVSVLAENDGLALLLEFAEGKGSVLACQLQILPALGTTPPAGQLLMNLLACAAAGSAANRLPEHPALAGDFTPVPPHAGMGFAEEFWLLNQPVDARTAERLVRATVRANADYPPVQIFGLGGHWERIHRTDGWASAIGCSASAPILLFSRFHADVELSNLRIEGEGAVRVSVGGATHEALLADGGATLSDIPLQRGYNAVLVLWKPARPESRLRPVWCNAQGQPQTAFTFR